jgi:hypothetical protein
VCLSHWTTTSAKTSAVTGWRHHHVPSATNGAIGLLVVSMQYTCSGTVPYNIFSAWYTYINVLITVNTLFFKWKHTYIHTVHTVICMTWASIWRKMCSMVYVHTLLGTHVLVWKLTSIESTKRNVAVSISGYVNELFIFVDQDKLKDTLFSFQGNNIIVWLVAI